MSVWVSGWVFTNYTDGTPLQKLLLLSLADEANDEGVSCYPGVRRLADKTNCSVGAVRENLAKLESSSEIVIVRPERQGRGNHNEYGVCMGRDPLDVLALIKGTSDDPFTVEETRGKGTLTRGKGTAQTALTQDPDPGPNKELSPSIGFEEFWPLYPRKQGRKRAEKLWSKLDDAQRRAAIDYIPTYAGMVDDPKFVKHGDSYLSQEPWRDEGFAAPPELRIVEGPKSYADPSCNTCGGSGWDTGAGSVVGISDAVMCACVGLGALRSSDG